MTGRHTRHVGLIVGAILLCGMTLSSCATHTDRAILGGTAWFTEGRYQIISDIKISELQIRRVRELGIQGCGSRSEVYDHIQLYGPINADATYVVERLLETIMNSNRCTNPANRTKYVVSVYLHSWGGYLRDGYELGELFRRYRAQTWIPYGGECFSACATAFLGGTFRKMTETSTLMFHAPYKQENNFSRDIVCASEEGGSVTEELRRYFVKMLNQRTGDLLHQRTMSYCGSNTGWFLNPDAARLFGLLAG